MNRKMKKDLQRILIAALLFVIAFITERYLPWGVYFALYMAAYLSVGYLVLLRAGRNILKGRVLDENFLMCIATVGAFAVGEYSEAVVVMLFYQIGELFEHYAVSKSRKSISTLMDIRPEFANVLRNGEFVRTAPEEVCIGDTIRICPGERVPLDGVICQGNSFADMTALTGESVPREVLTGDTLLSGSINITGVVEATVTKTYGESTVSRILELVENASSKKSKQEQFITRFAVIYTPVVVGLAVLLAVIPPLVIPEATFSEWLYQALSFLVVSCPCALVISVPLSFFGGIGGASRAGILVKGSNYLEALSKAEIVAFDKTGTLTEGVFEVSSYAPSGCTKEELLQEAALTESFSSHPISLSLKKAYREVFHKELDTTVVSGAEEIPGHGVKAVAGTDVLYAGNALLMKEQGVSVEQQEAAGTTVYVMKNNVYRGAILISDRIKPDAKEAIVRLKKLGVKKTVMLTGDAKSVGIVVAKELGLDEVCTELLPAQKVECVERLLKEKSEKGMLAYAGDGMNDAPVLAMADVGIAMGGLGSDAAIEAADVVIMTDEPKKIADLIEISRKTLGIVRQNIIFALGVKALVLLLCGIGIGTMWEAVFADVGVSVIAILNALRALSVKPHK